MLGRIRGIIRNQLVLLSSAVASINSIENHLARQVDTTLSGIQKKIEELAQAQSRSETETASTLRQLKDHSKWGRRALSDLYRLQLLQSNPRYSEPGRLLGSGAKFFSQNDEDGIIAEIFNRIGITNRTFIEIGAGAGDENNTLFLLVQGWQGCWLEANATAVENCLAQLKRHIDSGALRLANLRVTKENISGVLKDLGAATDPDLLSIDLDGNDYHILGRCLEFLRPRVIVAEYNVFLGPSIPLILPYDPEHRWDGSTKFGASLKAFELLGREHGYSLVGCNISGVNAFFVQDELVADKFAQPYSSENHFEPCRFPQIEFGLPYRASVNDFRFVTKENSEPSFSNESCVYLEA